MHKSLKMTKNPLLLTTSPFHPEIHKVTLAASQDSSSKSDLRAIGGSQ